MTILPDVATVATAAQLVSGAELLDRAANIVDRGWCRHALQDEFGHCAIGALGAARRTYSSWAVAIDQLAGVLGEQYAADMGCVPEDGSGRLIFNPVSYIAAINDYYATSGAEIAGCMRKAANQLRDDAAFKEFGA